MTPFRAAATPLVIAALAACSSGGSSDNPQEVAFASFDAVRPNQVAVLNGTAQTASGAMSGDTVTSATLGPAAEDGTLRLTYDGSRNISAIDFNVASGGASFDNVRCEAGLCVAETATATLVAADAQALGWNYQSFGIWLEQPNASTFRAGAMSAGAVTPGSAVPTTGTANFSGGASGFYVNPSGTPFVTAASMSAAVDFTARSVGFSTSSTTIADLNGSALPTSADQLNLSGTLNYGAGVNQFTGPVTNTEGMTGTATGRFYGPAAEEMGGTYGVTGAGPSRMIGAFGAKR